MRAALSDADTDPVNGIADGRLSFTEAGSGSDGMPNKLANPLRERELVTLHPASGRYRSRFRKGNRSPDFCTKPKGYKILESQCRIFNAN